MLSLNTIRNESSDSSYQRGKSYYLNNKVTQYVIEPVGKNCYKLKASIKGTSIYKTTMTVDVARDSIIQWYCSCPYDFGGMCKHLIALGMKFHYDHLGKDIAPVGEYVNSYKVEEENLQVEYSRGDVMRRFNPAYLKDSGAELLQELEESQNYSRDALESDNIQIILQKFNITSDYLALGTGENDIKDLRLSLKILLCEDVDKDTSNLANEKGLRIDSKVLRSIPIEYSLLFDYISTNGRYIKGVYEFGHSCIDMLFSMLSGLNGVWYGSAPERITFSEQTYKPVISMVTREDGSVSTEFEEDLLVIPGKHSSFVLKDGTIMRLPSELSPKMYMKIYHKSAIVTERLVDRLFKTAVPVLKHKFNLDDTRVKKIENIDIAPEVNLFIKYGKKDNEVYLLPQVRYGEYLSINPFSPELIKKFSSFYYASSGMETGCRVDLGDRIINFSRDIYKENEVYSRLSYNYILESNEEGTLIAAGNRNIYMLLKELLPHLPQDWKIFYDKGLENLRIKNEDIKIDFDFSVDVDNGLLDFDVDFHCGNLNITREALFDYINNNREFLMLDGSFVEISNKGDLERLFSILGNLDLGSRKDGRFTGKLYQAGELNALIEGSRDFSLKCSESYRSFMHELKTGKPVDEVAVPPQFNNVLRSYQIEGVQWMHFLRKYGFGGILADDMGLGKTLQALVMLLMAPKGTTSLVVCPKTLIYNWYNEIQKFAPDLKVLIADGNSLERPRKLRKAKDYDVVVTSYPLLHKDIHEYVCHEFEYCIIDEAQYIKNSSTKTAHSVKSIKAKHKLAMTGTPIENSVMELWSIFDFVMPGFLGSESSFKARYEKYGDMSALRSLNARVKPFILRRTKKEMLKELPPRIDQVSYSELTPGQLALYTRVLEQVRSEVYTTVSQKGFQKSQIEILAALTRLRQICNHPGLVDDRFLKEKSISGKLELFEELVEEAVDGGHKVLVFSQFTKMLDILRKFMDKRDIEYCYLDGQTRDRQDIVQEFNDNNRVKVFLISIKAGGFGLNLTSADTVIIYDPWWNPMVEEQAADRAYRMGQQNTVNVYRLITKGTVEEKIQKLQERKRALFDAVINENNEFIKKLTWEELQEVLS